MSWTIRKELLKSSLMDERGVPVAQIRCRWGSYRIQDMSGNDLCELYEEGHHLLSFTGRHKGTVRLTLGERSASLLPPRAREAIVEKGPETIRILQDEQRRFVFYQSGGQIGSMEDLLAFRVRFDLDQPFQADEAALLYSIAHRMLHEDDIDYV